MIYASGAPMKIENTPLQGLRSFTPKRHKDSRGFFMETWRDEWYALLEIQRPFIQENHARSEQAGVLRGLHYQRPPCAQAKLVWVTRGAILDVAVDLRQSSPTYAQWFSIELSAENATRFYIPRGFAHGYVTLKEGTEVQYKVDGYYSPDHEGGILWNDPDLAIPWGTAEPILSPKDTVLPALKNFDSPFI